MSSANTNSLEFLKQHIDDLIVRVILADKYATLELLAIIDGIIRELNAPTFEFTGDVNGVMLPFLQQSATGGYDVGPRWPSIKFAISEKDKDGMYELLMKYNRAIHLGYYAAALAKLVKEQSEKGKKLSFKPNLGDFVGFRLIGVDDDYHKVVPVFARGIPTKLNDMFEGSEPDVLSFTKVISKTFGRAPNKDGDLYFLVPEERPIFYDPAAKAAKSARSGEKRIYIEPKLAHNSFPTKPAKYRAPNQPATPEMQDPSRWGIVIPMLNKYVVDGKDYYSEPKSTLNWVNYPNLGFKAITSDKDSNYFIGKVIFEGNRTTHFDIKVDGTTLSPKFNIAWVANVFKLPGESTMGKGRTVKSGFDKVEVSEEDILKLHGGGSPAVVKSQLGSVSQGVSPVMKKKSEFDPSNQMPSIGRQNDQEMSGGDDDEN